MYKTIYNRNFDLDLEIAELRGITLDGVDELPLAVVELERENIIAESPDKWELENDQ
tara:strand:- start:1735 stop:1905 length:171 start_codon:yes stop_codon:yes gene_type:complete